MLAGIAWMGLAAWCRAMAGSELCCSTGCVWCVVELLVWPLA